MNHPVGADHLRLPAAPVNAKSCSDGGLLADARTRFAVQEPFDHRRGHVHRALEHIVRIGMLGSRFLRGRMG